MLFYLLLKNVGPESGTAHFICIDREEYGLTETIDGAMFVHMLGEGTRNLSANKQLVNDLNVFPIPDGDTGDNMLMTISSGFEAVADADNESLETVVDRAAQAMLFGARGNSGVILSKIFAGIAAGFSGSGKSAGIREFGRALSCGVKEAYSAVPVPVEGTMLTVFREAVERANNGLEGDCSADEYFNVFMNEIKESLDRTPELLSVLKEAGVVDSGGAGIMFIVEGMVKALRGEYSGSDVLRSSPSPASGAPDFSKFTEDSKLVYGYCTEFLLRLQRDKVDLDNFDLSVIIDYLSSAGDSVVCFRSGSIVKVHVHTFKPGEILNKMQEYGEFLTMKIENMTLQHNENTPGVNARTESSGLSVAARRAPHKKFATVTVANGKGLKETFISLGVDAVVDGGQSMNPSAADFLDTFAQLNADHILVFPNNGNIIMTARQAGELYKDAAVHVVNTRTIGQGYAAVAMLDISSGDPDSIVAQAEEAGMAAVTASISVASRDADMNGVCVHKDDFIGFDGDRVYVDDPDRENAAFRLAEAMDAGSFDVILVLSGAGADPAKAQELTERLTARFPRTEFILIDGGQPVYDYILILE